MPKILQKLILTLLEKQPEERYQTAQGLTSDLQRLVESAGSGRFPTDTATLRTSDLSVRVNLRTKLYGRGAQQGQIREAVEDTERKQVALALIRGPSGIGKTALVLEATRRTSTSTQARFISGKFESLKRDTPFLALWQAIRLWAQQTLALPDAALEFWRERLLGCLGRNARLVTQEVPELRIILGDQGPVPELGPTENRARFQFTMRALLSGMGRQHEPLVLFLDDLQWADAASLALIEGLVAAERLAHVVLIGAYRDNEVDPRSAFSATLTTLLPRAHVLLLDVGPLGAAEVHAMLSDLLGSEAGHKELDELLIERSAGNPFVLREMLDALLDHALLRVQVDRDGVAAWHWDIDEVRRSPLSETVAGVLMQRAHGLSDDALGTLSRAACIGNTFSLTQLSLLSDAPMALLAAQLRAAVERELLTADADGEATLAALAGGLHVHELGADVQLRFRHDRIHQAMYAEGSAQDRASRHLEIARKFEARDRSDADDLFDIANHYQLAAGSLTDTEERRKVAKLALRAGRRALRATAYASARKYGGFGIDLLGRTAGWQTDFETLRDLSLLEAESTTLLGDLDQASLIIGGALSQLEDPIDRARFLRLRVVQYTLQGTNLQAIDAVRSALSPLGVEVPTLDSALTEFQLKLGRLDERLKGVAIQSLAQLPNATDARDCLVIELLAALNPPAYFTSPNLVAWNSAAVLERSLERGYAWGSSTGFVIFGNVIANILGRYEDGLEFGKLSLELADARDEGATRCINRLIFANNLCNRSPAEF